MSRNIIKNIISKQHIFGALSITALMVVVAISAAIVIVPEKTQAYETQDASWYTDWSYRKSISFDHNQVNSTQAYIPVLINISSDADLVAGAQVSGNDILFTLNDGTTKLNHEIELYNSTTGRIVAWVNVTSLSHSADTTIYMYYGNATCGNQEAITDTWDSHYVSVWHCNNASNPLTDSTVYGKDTSNQEGTPTYHAEGKIGYGVTLNRTNPDGWDIANDYGIFAGLHNYTLESWYYSTDDANAQRILNFYGEALVFFTLEGGVGDDNISFYTREGAWDILSIVGYPTNAWTFAACSQNTINGKSLYVNSEIATNSWTGSNEAKTDENSLGCNGLAPDDGVTGSLDELRISDITRSTDWLTACYNMVVNGTDGGFFTLGAQEEEDTSVYVLKGLTSNYLTWAGIAGQAVWCNTSGDGYEWLEINMTINATDNVTEIRVFIANLNDTGAWINTSNITLYVSDSTNTTYYEYGTFLDGGSNISINKTTWNTYIGINNPFNGTGLTDTNTSIFCIFKLTIPSDSPTDTFYTVAADSYKIYLGTVS